MIEAVLDASALLAFLRAEAGAGRVGDVLGRACVSAVNLAETFGKLIEYGGRLEEILPQFERLQIPVIPFGSDHARLAAALRTPTRRAGLSLGDRACLALAIATGVPAFTTEGQWLTCDTGAKVVKIR